MPALLPYYSLIDTATLTKAQTVQSAVTNSLKAGKRGKKCQAATRMALAGLLPGDAAIRGPSSAVLQLEHRSTSVVAMLPVTLPNAT